jgi:hypothetical protein
MPDPQVLLPFQVLGRDEEEGCSSYNEMTVTDSDGAYRLHGLIVSMIL